MKAQLYSSSGSKKSDLELPSVFNSMIREDLAHKYFEANKFLHMQPYTHDPEAGKKHSASGTISHKRHEWKGHYGKGISRIPRKTMYRRGTQFFWIAAEVSQARGGRAAHGPTGILRPRKINKNEQILAMNSAFAATANKDYVVKRYSTLNNIDSAPLVVESLPNKTKEAIETLRKIFGSSFSVVLKKKEIRAGKGKSRGRKYKSNAGLLVITGAKEKIKLSGVDVKQVREVGIRDLYPLGRLTLYTKQALEEMK